MLDVGLNVSEAADLSRPASVRPYPREHGNSSWKGRCAIERKILMHRPGYSTHIYQDGFEVSDMQYNLKNLNPVICLRVLEEPFPPSSSSPLVRYTVNQSVIGNLMAQDPTILCYGAAEGPHLLPFVFCEEKYSVILLNLNGDPLVISS